jgi:3-phosphoshikimate 1-carboxyvinyltransferase
VSIELTAEPWPAPTASAPLAATVRVPGSKSLTNRALVLAALAESPSTIRHPLHSRDSELMVGALRALGVEVVVQAETLTVTPRTLQGGGDVDAGLAGTVMRFVPPMAALADGPVTFDGDPRARERPLRPLVEALRSLGVDIEDGGRGALPLTVHGRRRVAGGAAVIDASASSQLVSALLLAAPRYDAGVDIRHVGGRLPSAPFVDMTVAMLRDRGAAVTVAGDRWTVEPGPLTGGDVDIEPDLSSAAPFLAAPLVAGGSVRIAGWPQHSLQPGARTPEVLARMGAEISFDEQRGLTVRGTGRVSGLDVDLGDNPELACVLAAVAAVADSPSRLRGIGHMRGHETDRLGALAIELTALGASVDEHDDGLTIEPRPLHGGVFRTYDDHRLAMAAAVLGLVVPGVLVENVGTAGKTFPGFAGAWLRLLTGSSA